jgi:hypothetical protein
MAVGLVACDEAAPRHGDPPDLTPVAGAALELPDSEAAFLNALVPLPEGDVRVTYDVTGPIGMHGTLVATARAGGYRHEAWAVEVGMPDEVDGGAPRRIEGSRLRTPDVSWTDAVGGAAVVRTQALGDVARAYLELEPGLQSLVAYRIGQWRRDIAQGRKTHPGTTDVVLDQPCLVTHVASHRVCVWEETGLPLTYAGEAFAVRATAIETNLAVDDDLFEVPPGGERAADDGARVDPRALVIALAAGDFAEVVALTQPGLGLATPQ